MSDYLTFLKIWQDEFFFQIKITCSSKVITVSNEIYSSNQYIDDLYNKLKIFLNEKVTEILWENGTRGNHSTACVSLRFLHKDKLGHILIEVFMELDDGGDYSSHNCCFYLNTEIGLLERFCEKLPQLKQESLGIKVILNDDA